MKSESVKFRSFGVGCNHQIELPNGKIILVDPFFSGWRDCKSELEKLERVDYVLITHTHFDHDMDIAYITEKFKPRIFVGALSAFEFMKYHKIPFDNVFPVFPGQRFTLDDFTLDTWQAKHNTSGGRTYSQDHDIALDVGMKGHKLCDDLGSLESLDFMITTNNSFRIMFVSGEAIFNDIYSVCKEVRPNIVFRQAGVREAGGDFFTGKQVEPNVLAELFCRYYGQIIVPFHYDVIVKKWGEEKTKEYFEQVRLEIEKRDIGATLVYPENDVWYGVEINIKKV